MIEPGPELCYFCGEVRRVARIEILIQPDESREPVPMPHHICGACLDRPFREIMKEAVEVDLNDD